MDCSASWLEQLDAAGAADLFIAAAGVLALAFVIRVVIRVLRNS